MAVYKRGKTYWIRFQWNGQEVRQSARTASRAEALTYERKLRDEFGRVHRLGNKRYTYNEAMTRFIEEYLPTLKLNSQTRYLTSGRKLYPHFNGKYLDQINKSAISEFIATRKRDGCGDTGIIRDLACLSSMFSFVIELDWVDANPVKSINKRKRGLKEPNGRLRFESREKFKELCEATEHPYLPQLMQFAVETGMRGCEQFALRHPQVDLDRAEAHLIDTKNGTERIVPLTPLACSIIRKWPRHIKSDLVFWHGDGKPFKRLTRPFQNACKRAEIKDFTWHDLRHTFASWWVQDGKDIIRLKEVMGHKKVETTMIYAHLRTQDLHTEMNKVGTKTGTRHKERKSKNG